MDKTHTSPHQRVLNAFDADVFREQGHQLVDLLADYLQQAPQGKINNVYPQHDPDELAQKFARDLEAGGKTAEMMAFFKEVMDNNIHTLHPQYIGHQVATPFPANALADFMGSLMNSGMGVYEMGSPMVALERVVVMQVVKALGYGEAGDGVLTSGGSLGNLTALLCARSVKAGGDIWQEGYAQGEQLALMVSEESHYCVNRAVKIMGWGEAGIVTVPTNAQRQMDPRTLEVCYQEALRAGKNVIAVVANACSTATGSYDPIEAIADFCEKHDLWMHVDGAHGGGVIFSDKYRHLVKGLERADSVIIDFHKMLSTTALATALVFKQGQQGYKTFAQKASYLWENSDQQEWFNLGKRTLECTKHAMSLRVYTLLRFYGQDVLAAHLDYLYDLTKEFYAFMRLQKDFQVAMAPDANILCFRYTPEEESQHELDALNARIRKALIREGDFYIVQTQLDHVLYLRTTLMNSFTTMEHLKDLIARIRAMHPKKQKA